MKEILFTLFTFLFSLIFSQTERKIEQFLGKKIVLNPNQDGRKEVIRLKNYCIKVDSLKTDIDVEIGIFSFEEFNLPENLLKLLIHNEQTTKLTDSIHSEKIKSIGSCKKNKTKVLISMSDVFILEGFEFYMYSLKFKYIEYIIEIKYNINSTKIIYEVTMIAD